MRLAVIAVVLGVLLLLLVLLAGSVRRRAADDISEAPRLRLVRRSAFPVEGERPLRNPRSLLVMGDRVYVAEADAANIAVFDLEGRRLGDIRLKDGERTPYPVALASLDRWNLLVLDTASSKLYEVSSAIGERTLREWGPKLSQPTAIARWGDRVAVADAGSSSILLLDDGGRRIREYGQELDPALTFVGGMEEDGRRLLVSDSNAGRILVLDDKTGSWEPIPSRSSLPRGLAVLPGGRVAAVDAFEGALRVYSRSGDLVVEDKSLNRPQDAAFSRSGNLLFVTDSGDGRVIALAVVGDREK